MTNSASVQPEPQTEAEYEAAFERLLVEMKSINDSMVPGGQMHSDRCEIERLKAETQVLRNETRALLVSMGAKL